jgi:hypothetical protein
MLNCRILNDVRERMQKKIFMVYLNIIPSIFLEELSKTTKIIDQYSQSPG